MNEKSPSTYAVCFIFTCSNRNSNSDAKLKMTKPTGYHTQLILLLWAPFFFPALIEQSYLSLFTDFWFWIVFFQVTILFHSHYFKHLFNNTILIYKSKTVVSILK